MFLESFQEWPDAEMVALFVDEENPRAARFWKRYGFVEYPPSYEQAGHVNVRMVTTVAALEERIKELARL